MVQKFPGKVSRNSVNCKISEMRTIQLKILEIREQSWMERKLPKRIFENLGIPHEVVLCVGNFWKCCSICYWKLPKIQAGRFGRMESAHCFQNLILINQLLVQSVFTWRHGGHIGVPKQWNGGHVGVPNQSCGSWTIFLCKLFLLFQ